VRRDLGFGSQNPALGESPPRTIELIVVEKSSFKSSLHSSSAVCWPMQRFQIPNKTGNEKITVWLAAEADVPKRRERPKNA
jgi:hypothetical protein